MTQQYYIKPDRSHLSVISKQIKKVIGEGATTQQLVEETGYPKSQVLAALEGLEKGEEVECHSRCWKLIK